MKESAFQKVITITISLPLLLFAGFVRAEEQVIQKEKISFERCLTVIDVSKDKLSIDPEISEPSENKRIAVFELSDGKLTITCDGLNGFVTVTTKID